MNRAPSVRHDVVPHPEDGPTLMEYRKFSADPEELEEVEALTSIAELHDLYATCSARWGEGNWDLEKLKTCVRECEFD